MHAASPASPLTKARHRAVESSSLSSSLPSTASSPVSPWSRERELSHKDSFGGSLASFASPPLVSRSLRPVVVDERAEQGPLNEQVEQPVGSPAPESVSQSKTLSQHRRISGVLTGTNIIHDGAESQAWPTQAQPSNSTMTPSMSVQHEFEPVAPLAPPSPASAAHPAVEHRERPHLEPSSVDRARKPSNAGVSTATAIPRSNKVPTAAAAATASSNRPTLPRLPHASVSPAPPPSMYWSKTPVHGSVPKRCFRAHTASLCDDTMWLFGGCDSKGCFGSIWCFDVETMCWSKPRVNGDVPSPRRAHSATMVDKRLFVFAGGDGPHYFRDLYVFDTVSLRWSKPEVLGNAVPTARRAHSANYWNGHIIIFGGGNGVGALNDVWLLDVRDPSRLEWKELSCDGKIPIGRGYHTGNVVDDKLIVIGGSDGHMSFNDIHVLRLDTRTWYQVKTDEVHNRLGHTSTQVGSYLFVFGGHDSKGYSNEILTLNLVNLQWEPRRVCGQRPAGRGYHQAWLKDSRLFVHGGFDGKDVFDDLYLLDLAACSYLPQITQFSVVLEDDEDEGDEVDEEAADYRGRHPEKRRRDDVLATHIEDLRIDAAGNPLIRRS